MLDKLKETPNKTIGTRQTLKALENDQAEAVFLAMDAEERVISGIKELCLKKGIKTIFVATMKELGGTSISGGKATVHGTFIGVLIMGAISNALNIVNVPSVMQDVAKGLIIIIALYFDVIVVSRKNK
jgi:large subunit ribosomal protein L7A